MLNLFIRNCNITINNTKDNDNLKKIVHDNLDPLDPNRFHVAAFKRWHTWDGRVKLCTIKKNEDIKVPTGLYNELLEMLKSKGYNYTIKDLRGSKLAPNSLDEDIILKGDGVKTIKPRDYQMEAVKLALKEQRGVIESATASGKTTIFYLLVNYIVPLLKSNEKFLFIVHKSDIMNQVYDNTSRYLTNVKIGKWGDSVKDLNAKVICSTVQTLHSALRKPDIKLTSEKDKRLKRFATKYYDQIINNEGNYYQNLKLFVANFRPTYLYENRDKEELKNLAYSLNSAKGVKSYFDNYVKRYNKLLTKKGSTKLKKYTEAVDFMKSVRAVVIDEAHTAASESYQNIFTYLSNARLRIGMTGTLDKSKKMENLKIKAILGNVLLRKTDKDMENRGFIAKPHIILINETEPKYLEQKVELELKRLNVPKSQADLTRYQLAYHYGVITNKSRNTLIAKLVNKLLSKDSKKAILIVVNSLEHGEYIQKALKDFNIEAIFLQGKDNTDIRKNVINKVKSGNQQVLIATKIMDEGIDIPNFRYFINCAAGKSYIQLLQRIGRVVRLQKDKKDVFIFDIVDRTHKLLYNQAVVRARYYKNEGFDIIE